MLYEPKRDEAIFRKEGDLLVPGILAKGPWYDDSLHGSPMMGAMAWAAENHPTDVPRQVSRITVDMMRAAPMAPLRPETTTVRSGKNIDFIDIKLFAGDEVCVRGTAMRIRTAEVIVEDYFRGIPPYPKLPEDTGHRFFQHPGAENPAFHHAIELRMDQHQGYPVIWFKLAVPLVEGEENSSFIKVATICDWTYAVPNITHRTEAGKGMEEQSFFSINPDTTVNYFKPMTGDWLGVKSQSTFGDMGSGTCAAQLFDEEGPVGFSSQSILTRGMEGAPLFAKEKK